MGRLVHAQSRFRTPSKLEPYHKAINDKTLTEETERLPVCARVRSPQCHYSAPAGIKFTKAQPRSRPTFVCQDEFKKEKSPADELR